MLKWMKKTDNQDAAAYTSTIDGKLHYTVSTTCLFVVLKELGPFKMMLKVYIGNFNILWKILKQLHH